MIDDRDERFGSPSADEGNAPPWLSGDPADRLRLVEELARIGLWDLDLRRNRGAYDAALRDLCGLAEDHATYEAFTRAVHPDDRERARAAMERAIRGEGPYQVEFRFIRPDGQIRWFESRGIIDRDAEGRAVRCRGVALDVTERKARERALRFLGEAGALLSESLDYKQALRRVAEAAVPEIADACAIDLVGQRGTPERLVEVSTAPAPVLPRAALVTAPQLDGGRGSVPIVRRGASVGTFHLYRARPRVFGPDDLALAREIAWRAGLAIDSALLLAEANEAIRARDEFLLVASHELRNPLAALQLSIQGLRQTACGNSPGRQARALDLAERQTARLAALLDELLSVSRIEAGGLLLAPEQVEVREVVDTTARALTSALARAGCELRVHAPDQPVEGRWDPLRLGQVLTNLLRNAIKFGAGKPIDVTISPERERVRLQVQDKGIGIAPERLPFVFGRFERAVSSREYGGLGLGLYLVRRIVEAHGGRVDVTSEPGAGSLFTVDLPYAVPVQP